MKKVYPNFSLAIHEAFEAIKQAPLIHPASWQGLDVSKRPEAKTYELLNYDFAATVGTRSLSELQREIQPNLPWADDHFAERVGGQPINPGEEWKNWPWGNSANKFRDEDGQFNHNYMERYWPKWANNFHYKNGHTTQQLEEDQHIPHRGIRFTYGDLHDVVDQIANDPTTRQAYLPVFFPEDTGATHGGRVPCSLGYHFIQRGGFLHINYYLRSCEAYRHFRDDIYLTVRLLLWMVERLKEKGHNFTPGIYTMYMTSFHLFVNDKELLK